MRTDAAPASFSLNAARRLLLTSDEQQGLWPPGLFSVLNDSLDGLTREELPTDASPFGALAQVLAAASPDGVAFAPACIESTSETARREEAQRTPMDASHRRIAAELQTASKRRLELEEELRLLKASAAPVATA